MAETGENAGLREILETALAAERKASQTYSGLAARMSQHRRDDLAEVFVRLAREEAAHAGTIERAAAGLGLALGASATPPAWHDPNLVALDRELATEPATSTPYRALAYAVENEELAFRFFCHAAAMASNPQVRDVAEGLAHEELGHAARLRQWRRAAFQQARRGVPPADLPRAADLHDLADLLAAAAALEADNAAGLLAVAGSDAELLALATDAAATGRALETELRALTGAGGAARAARAVATQRPALLDALERTFAFYDAVVDSARDEDVGRRAQALAGATLRRLAALRRHDDAAA